MFVGFGQKVTTRAQAMQGKEKQFETRLEKMYK
jgi:hypothetical protein